jgi:hypothetical protein
MSANPVIHNLRGIRDKDNKPLVMSNILSTSSMLAPFSMMDDPKRSLYTNIQNSHIIPIENPKAFPVRTGYDSVVPYRMDKKFVDYAKKDGTVLKVTKTSVTIKYKDGEKETFTFKEWTSKEESNAAFKHTLKTDLVEKQKVKYGDIVYYDPSFFEPDIFDKTKVIYRANMIINVAWQEVQETYEDALMISQKVGEETKASQIKVRDLVLNKDDEISELADIGKEIHPNTPLFTLVSNVINDDKLDKKTLDLLQSFIKVSPKAKYKGKLLKVRVYYNCEYKELSKSLKKLVDISKPFMSDEFNKTYEGRVNSSYSINAVPLEEGKLHIKFYIDVNEGMTPGDKAVISNQLKSTVTTLYDYPVTDELGNEIDAIFSQHGALARIVNSPTLMGTTATVLDEIGKKAVEMYFK